MALEASSRNLVALGMQDFDYEKARKVLQISDSFDIMSMIAIGRKELRENLPSGLQEKEYQMIENL